MKSIFPAIAASLLALPVAAHAQSTVQDKVPAETAPPPSITISGSAAIASDYRFRGVSQSDQEMTVQGGITIAHESGFYVGTWASNLAGWARSAPPTWNWT